MQSFHHKLKSTILVKLMMLSSVALLSTCGDASPKIRIQSETATPATCSSLQFIEILNARVGGFSPFLTRDAEINQLKRIASDMYVEGVNINSEGCIFAAQGEFPVYGTQMELSRLGDFYATIHRNKICVDYFDIFGADIQDEDANVLSWSMVQVLTPLGMAPYRRFEQVCFDAIGNMVEFN